MAQFKTSNPSTYKMNQSYKLRLKEYVEKRYPLVDQDWYAGKNKENTYQFGDNHILVLTASNDPFKEKNKEVRALTMWTEYDLANMEKPVASGQIFDLIAKEKGVENTPNTYRTVLLPEVVKALGKYTQEQVRTTTTKIDNEKVKKINKKALSPDEVEKRIKTDKTVNRQLIVPMEYNIINEIQKSGTLFGQEPKAMPMLFRPNQTKGYPFHSEREADFEKEFMTGLQYVQALQDDTVIDKRYVYLTEMNYSWKGWGKQGVQPVEIKSKDADGKEVLSKAFGKPYLYVHHPKGTKSKDDNNGKGFAGKRYVLPLSSVTLDGMAIGACKLGVNDNNAVADRMIAHYPGLFTDPDDKVTKALQDGLRKDPVKAFRDAVALHSGISKIQKVRGLYLLQRELIVDWGLRACGYKGKIEIPEADRASLLHYMKSDVIGYEKSVCKGPKEYVRVRQEPCHYFRMSVVNMDTQNRELRHLQAKLSAIKEMASAKEVAKREKFAGLSIVMDTAYLNRNKGFYPKGAGLGAKKIAGVAAYELLADMLIKDKEMYDNDKHMGWNPDAKGKYSDEERKEVRLTLSLGDDTPPLKLVFQPGHLDMNNAVNVSDAIIALQARKEYDNAYNKNTIDRNYKTYVDLKRFDNPDFKVTPATRYEFIEQERVKFYSKLMALKRSMAKNILKDESEYLNDHPQLHRKLMSKADTFMYAVPRAASREQILEGFESKNVIRITEPGKLANTNPDFSMVELRNQLDVLKRDDAIVRDDKGNAYYYDASPSHRTSTEKMQVVPWLSNTAVAHAKDFNDKFSVTVKMDGEELTIKGDSARELLVGQMTADRDSYEWESQKQLRRESDLEPYSLQVDYDGKTLFAETGHYGEMKLGNFNSVEEMLVSQRGKMTPEENKGLDEMLKAEMVAKKYSEVKEDEDYLRACEKVTQKEIDAVRKKPMRSYEASAMLEEGENLSPVEVFERDAKVNHIEEPEKVMNYVATAMVKKAVKDKDANALETVTETLKASYPDKTDMIEKVMKDDKILKLGKSKGIHRNSSGLSRGSRAD